VFTGNPDEVASDIRQFEELGVRHLIVGVAGASTDETIERMERFASEVRLLV
jgi:hypothetical protein